MGVLSEIEILEARIEMLKARVSELEIANKHYLELIKARDEELRQFRGCHNCGKYNGYGVCECQNKDKWEKRK